jgi:Cu/Ag efflux pump CusA
MMLIGGNSRTVSAAVDAKMKEIAHSLPRDVQTTTVLNRTLLVDATVHTVERNLGEGALLVILILLSATARPSRSNFGVSFARPRCVLCWPVYGNRAGC